MPHSKRDERTANDRSFCSDRRAIEGLPVRLVIALVVGVASLSVMMGMIGDIDGLAATELDAQPQPEVTTPGEQSLDVAVLDPDGSRVADATVIVRSGSAQIDGVATGTTGSDGTRLSMSTRSSDRTSRTEPSLWR